MSLAAVAAARPGRRAKKVVVSGPASSEPSNPIRLGDVVYFTADDGKHGNELWLTDGTADGTRLVADIWPGSASSSIVSTEKLGGQLFFFADDGTHGLEPWALSCGNGALDPGEECDDGAHNGDDTSCCSATCSLRGESGQPCHLTAGPLELRRARLQADGSSPGDTGSITVDGYLTVGASASSSFDFGSGLRATVGDGAAFQHVLEWPASACEISPSGVVRCAQPGTVATFRKVAGGSNGQRYFFSVGARHLAIAGPFIGPLDVVLTTSDKYDRPGSLASCTVAQTALACQ